MGSEPFQDSTRLSKAQRAELLRILDLKSVQHGQAHDSKRRQARFEYRADDVQITITHPSGGVGRFLVSTRNLSCGGLSFIHGGFLHLGTNCRIVLPRLDGRETVVLGRVVSCRHIAQRIHEVGVTFYEKIDVSEYCDPSEAASIPADRPGVPVPSLECLVLCIAADATERSQLGRWLSAAGADSEPADCLGAGLDRLKRLPFDVVICDMNLPEAVAGEAVGEIRGAGFDRSIVGILDSSDAAGPRRAACDAGLERPLSAERLYELLPDLVRGERAGAKASAPLFSTLERDAGAASMLKAYVEECRQSARRLREALEQESRDQVLSIAKHVQSTGAGYGFAPLVEAAHRVIVTLEASGSLAEASRRVRLLESICMRVTGDAPRRAA